MNWKRVIAFVLVVTMTSLCAGCFGGLNRKYDAKTGKAVEYRDCSGIIAPAILSSGLTIGLGVGSGILLGVVAPSRSDSCEGFCWPSPREEAEIWGIVLGVLAAVSLVATVVGVSWRAIDCHRQNAHIEFLAGLSPEEMREYEREKSIEHCKELKSSAESFPNARKWALYLSKCKGIESYPAINEGVLHWVKWLLSSRNDLNTKDDQGWTPLHYAAYTGNEKLVKYLLKKGADPNIKDNEVKTALDIAVEKGHEGVVELLRKAIGGGE